MRRRTVVLALLGAVAISFALRRWVVRVSEMRSRSMQPALIGDEQRGGDYVLIDILGYRCRSPARGEVAAFWDDAGGLSVMKRVAGLPGERVAIDARGAVRIDGRTTDEPRVERRRYQPAGNVRAGRVYDVQAGRYFVLGDHTRDSYDSRYRGAIPRDSIYGRAVWILWPPRRFGPVR